MGRPTAGGRRTGVTRKSAALDIPAHGTRAASTGDPTHPMPDPIIPPEDETPNARQMREALEAANSRADRIEKLALAGVDFSSPIGKMFVKSYDGELTDEAIATAATEVGALKTATPAGETTPTTPAAETPPTDTPLAPGEAGATGDRQDLANGAAPAGGTTPDPREAAKVAAKDVLDRTGNRGNALAEAFGTLTTAAAKGDQRVTVDIWNQPGPGDAPAAPAPAAPVPATTAS